MVDIVTQSWNQLQPWVFEASEAILTTNTREEVFI
jgi:hypothetical protein